MKGLCITWFRGPHNLSLSVGVKTHYLTSSKEGTIKIFTHFKIIFITLPHAANNSACQPEQRHPTLFNSEFARGYASHGLGATSLTVKKGIK